MYHALSLSAGPFIRKHDTMKAHLASCKPQVACFRSVLTTHAKQALKPTAVSSPVKHNHNGYDDRRQVLLSGVLGTVAMCTSYEVSAIPLAPLGKRTDRVGGDKLQMPTVDQVKVTAASWYTMRYGICSYAHTLSQSMLLLQDILRRDLAEGQYFITGDLTPEVFADDCRQMLCHCLRHCHPQRWSCFIDGMLELHIEYSC